MKAPKVTKSNFFQTWAKELKGANKATGGKILQIDARKLLPAADKWYRYEGSLTSEPYSEIVTWIVLPSPLGISSADLNQLKKEAHQPERAPQDVNRRFVLESKHGN